MCGQICGLLIEPICLGNLNPKEQLHSGNQDPYATVLKENLILLKVSKQGFATSRFLLTPKLFSLTTRVILEVDPSKLFQEPRKVHSLTTELNLNCPTDKFPKGFRGGKTDVKIARVKYEFANTT